MEGLLEYNSLVAGMNGILYQVGAVIKQTGECEYYEVTSEGHKYILKWFYRISVSSKLKDAIVRGMGLEVCSDNLLKPVDLVEIDKYHLGYIMDSLEDEYFDILQISKMKDFPFPLRCKAVFYLSELFLKLHSCGLCFGELSFEHIFVSRVTGNIKIENTEGLSLVSDDGDSFDGSIRLKAPEIILEKSKPGVDTDRYILAVLSFFLFIGQHPLEGRKELSSEVLSYEDLIRYYGADPVFIFDDKILVNRPDQHNQIKVYTLWKHYHPDIKSIFKRAFMEGLKNPEKRPTEVEWIDLMVDLLDRIVICPHCNEKIYQVHEYMDSSVFRCEFCSRMIHRPLSLRIRQKRVALSTTKEINEHHLYKNYRIDKVVGSVIKNPANPRILGIHNESDFSWVYIKPNGEELTVEPGKTAGIAKGVSIRFQDVLGIIV